MKKVVEKIPHLPDFLKSIRPAPMSDVKPGNLSGLTYSIETYGCQMNVNDSEIVESILQ